MRKVGEVSFYCGRACGVHVTTVHDLAGDAYAHKMRLRHYAEHREWPTIDKTVDWMTQGEQASRLRRSIRESEAIEAAIALLEDCGYTVRKPRDVFRAAARQQEDR